MLSRRDLDKRAFARIREELEGWGTLSRFLAALPIEHGSAYMWAPPDLPEALLYDFEHDQPYPHDDDGGEFQIVENAVVDFLLSEQLHLCVIEDRYAHPGDYDRNSTWVKCHLYGNEVYEILDPESARTGYAGEIIGATASDHFLACMTRTDSPFVIPPVSGQLAEGTLREFAANCMKLMVTAYRDCAFIFWERRPE